MTLSFRKSKTFSHVFDGTRFNKSGCEGFAYKMKMEAVSHQGIACGQVGHKSRDNISDTDSGRQVQRYSQMSISRTHSHESVMSNGTSSTNDRTSSPIFS